MLELPLLATPAEIRHGKPLTGAIRDVKSPPMTNAWEVKALSSCWEFKNF